MPVQAKKVIRCEIFAGDSRVRSFPDDRSLKILEAGKGGPDGRVLVLKCLDASGTLVEVETTLPYLLVQEVVTQTTAVDAAPDRTCEIPIQ